MTYPPVDHLPDQAAATLLSVCRQLSQSRQAALAGWAASVSDALLLRLLSVTTGVAVDFADIEPCSPLAQLNAAELKGLHSVVRAGADASDDEAVIEWCTRMSRLIVAEIYRRAYKQSVIGAKAAVIEAEEQRLRARRGQHSSALRRDAA